MRVTLGFALAFLLSLLSFNSSRGQPTISIGDTNIEGAADSDNGNLLLAQEATLSQTATIDSLSFYVTNAAGKLILGIYDASGKGGKPGKLMAATNAFSPAAGWNTQNVIAPVSLPAGNYWLAYLPSSGNLSFVKQNNSGNCYYYSHALSSGMAATSSTSPRNCTPTTWSLYATLTPAGGITAVNGVCGSANGTDVMSAPAANLCSAGAASAVTGSGPFDWTCAGSNSGTTASCAANLEINGSCGPANGVAVSSAPTANLCSTGAASAVTGSGAWAWLCAGSNGGSTALCSAPLTSSAVNGQCGSSNGAYTNTAPTSGLCNAGTATAVAGTGPWTWNCDGLKGGTNASCSAQVGNSVATIPADRVTDWSQPGLASVGGIPNRTTISKTLSPSGGDDTAAIQAALDACPAGEVVQLTAGVFKISGNGLSFTTSNCTLRGAGPGQQLNTGVNKVEGGGTVRSCVNSTPMTVGGDTFCVDPTATQLIKADRATNLNYAPLYVTPQDGSFGASINLAADAVQSTNSVMLVSNPGIQVGEIVLIDMITDNDPDVVYGPSFGPPGDGSRRWFSRQDRSLSQLMEVSAVSGNTITFDTPFHITFQTAYTAQLTRYTSPFLHEVGVENLFVWGGEGGDGHGNISVNNCAYCWVKNVEASWAVGTDIGFYSTFRSVLRDSYIHETPSPDPGGGGYLTGLNNAAADNLFENNIMWSGNKVDVMRATGGGNVLGYNYTDDSFGSQYPDSPEAGINAGHYTTPHMELLEGNYSDNFKGDTYWGNSIYITVFRNWLSALRASHPPLNAYKVTTDCVHDYGDYTGREAVDVQAYSFYQNFVGNVLGMQGQQLLTEPSGCDDPPENTFQELLDTTAQWNAEINPVVMWQIGTYQATVNTTGNWSFVDTTINTQLRNGNWDWATQGQHWYGIGGTTDGAVAAQALPNSLYLTATPAFFGPNPWPWVDPTTGTTYTLPAKYCFEHGMMPACLQNTTAPAQ
jgi:hypothetical protein